jgi:hypothetical protein
MKTKIVKFKIERQIHKITWVSVDNQNKNKIKR